MARAEQVDGPGLAVVACDHRRFGTRVGRERVACAGDLRHDLLPADLRAGILVRLGEPIGGSLRHEREQERRKDETSGHRQDRGPPGRQDAKDAAGLDGDRAAGEQQGIDGRRVVRLAAREQEQRRERDRRGSQGAKPAAQEPDEAGDRERGSEHAKQRHLQRHECERSAEPAVLVAQLVAHLEHGPVVAGVPGNDRSERDEQQRGGRPRPGRAQPLALGDEQAREQRSRQEHD